MRRGDHASPDSLSLRDWAAKTDGAARFFHDVEGSVALHDLAHGTSLGGRLPELAGRSVLIATGDQLTAALALIELDGVARRLVLYPSDLPLEQARFVIDSASVD